MLWRSLEGFVGLCKALRLWRAFAGSGGSGGVLEGSESLWEAL